MTFEPTFENLLPGPGATLLPDEPEPRARLEAGTPAAEVLAEHPELSLGWAELADGAFARGAVIESYAYARTGYHRGLDQLRRAGWKGFGPVPWEHVPNRGFLRCLFALGRAAEAIGEDAEVERIGAFLLESSPTAVEVLGSTG
jgi:hypothetical protein